MRKYMWYVPKSSVSSVALYLLSQNLGTCQKENFVASSQVFFLLCPTYSTTESSSDEQTQTPQLCQKFLQLQYLLRFLLKLVLPPLSALPPPFSLLTPVQVEDPGVEVDAKKVFSIVTMSIIISCADIRDC